MVVAAVCGYTPIINSDLFIITSVSSDYADPRRRQGKVHTVSPTSYLHDFGWVMLVNGLLYLEQVLNQRLHKNKGPQNVLLSS